MLLETLTLTNLGLFRGRHIIDLAPRKKYNSTRPIILFGGLNGAGKTTILNAIRLAIYGKQSLGYTVSQRAYDEYLASRVHRDPSALVQPDFASVSLQFLYYKLGRPTQYTVTRSWTVAGKQVSESLTILQDGTALPEFTQEQYQAFLNELIPSGVSELFFFDGEKIASLAEQDGDVALRDAIRKLLGLDIIERLKSDLHIYIRRQDNKSLPEEGKAQLKQYESDYKSLRDAISAEEEESRRLLPKLTAAKEVLGRLEEALAAKGGAWAQSRQGLKTRRDELIAAKKDLEGETRDYLSGLYPLSLAPNVLALVRRQLQHERILKEWDNTSQIINERLERVNAVIAEFVPKPKASTATREISSIFSDLAVKPAELDGVELRHDLASKDSERLEGMIGEALTSVPNRAREISSQLAKIDEELGNVSLQIERAPDEDSLKSDLEMIRAKNDEIAQLAATRNTHLELARRYTWQAIDLVRKMRHLQERLTAGGEQTAGSALASRARALLTDFAEELTKRKIEKLEAEFAGAFSRLARKADVIVRAQIDPASFEVHLFNESGKGIPRQDLSAGEKQIYAIAMLEALARTSGRKLPIIIDTPLGRLDSKHREKLVNNYFPHASHQVVILSTDTEVDEGFYEHLSAHVSHCFHISYDAAEGSSTVAEGYFWRTAARDKEVPTNAA